MVAQWRDTAESNQSLALRAHLAIAMSYLNSTLEGQQSIRQYQHLLGYIGLGIELGICDWTQSKSPLSCWLGLQLSTAKPRYIKKRLSNSDSLIAISCRAPEVLPAFSAQFGISVVILSSRKPPVVFGDLSIEDQPIIALSHAIDSMKGISTYHPLIVIDETRPPCKPRLPTAFIPVYFDCFN
jgi:hypothetical protein